MKNMLKNCWEQIKVYVESPLVWLVVSLAIICFATVVVVVLAIVGVFGSEGDDSGTMNLMTTIRNCHTMIHFMN